MSASKEIYLIDDDIVVRRLIPEYLKDAGFLCHCFESAEDALEALFEEKHTPSVMITDYNLPGMDGIELIKQTKDVTPDLPIILITAYSNHSVMRQAWNQGVFDFVEKPIKAETFVQTVELANAFGHDDAVKSENRVSINANQQNSVKKTNQTTAESNLIDWDFANSIKESLDDNTISEILMQLRLQYHDDIRKLITADNNRDFELMKEAAHRMAGMAANMGLSYVQKLSRDIEHADLDGNYDSGQKIIEIEKAMAHSIAELIGNWKLKKAA